MGEGEGEGGRGRGRARRSTSMFTQPARREGGRQRDSIFGLELEGGETSAAEGRLRAQRNWRKAALVVNAARRFRAAGTRSGAPAGGRRSPAGSSVAAKSGERAAPAVRRPALPRPFPSPAPPFLALPSPSPPPSAPHPPTPPGARRRRGRG